MPIYGPEPEIIPVEDSLGYKKEMERQKERRIIKEILGNDITLPWVQPSWKERGKG